MVLHIDQVFDQHFHTYIFEAENPVGKVTHKVALTKGKIYKFIAKNIENINICLNKYMEMRMYIVNTFNFI